jgi:hypothetical protein
MEGRPWTKCAEFQEPWCGFRLGELTECQKQLGVVLVWNDLFSGRKIEKEVRVHHRLRLCMQECDVLVHVGGKVADTCINMGP